MQWRCRIGSVYVVAFVCKLGAMAVSRCRFRCLLGLKQMAGLMHFLRARPIRRVVANVERVSFSSLTEDVSQC